MPWVKMGTHRLCYHIFGSRYYYCRTAWEDEGQGASVKVGRTVDKLKAYFRVEYVKGGTPGLYRQTWVWVLSLEMCRQGLTGCHRRSIMRACKEVKQECFRGACLRASSGLLSSLTFGDSQCFWVISLPSVSHSSFPSEKENLEQHKGVGVYLL